MWTIWRYTPRWAPTWLEFNCLTLVPSICSQAAKTGRPLVVSTGMSNMSWVSWLLERQFVFVTKCVVPIFLWLKPKPFAILNFMIGADSAREPEKEHGQAGVNAMHLLLPHPTSWCQLEGHFVLKLLVVMAISKPNKFSWLSIVSYSSFLQTEFWEFIYNDDIDDDGNTTKTRKQMIDTL